MVQPVSGHHLNLSKRLLRGASAALGVQVVALGLDYIARIFLARWMGVEQYGGFEYILNLGMFLAFFASLGLPSAALRFVPQYLASQQWGHLRGLIWGSWLGTAIASLTLALGATGLAVLLKVERSSPLLLGLWLVPLLALTRLQLEMTRATQRMVLAYAPSLIGGPLLLLVGGYGLRRWGTVTREGAIALLAAASTILLIGQLWLFARALSPKLHAAAPIFAVRQWLGVALPLLFIDGSFVVLNQTDLLMLGSLAGETAVGLYAAALKTAAWVGFVLMAVNATAAPLFSSLYSTGDRSGLQHVVSTVARWMFPVALAVGLGLMLFAQPILALFGPEFTQARGALLVLVLGQWVNVGAGSVGYLLIMTGHHRYCAIAMGTSAVLNVGFNAIGIPLMGIEGAAIATASCTALWNIWLYRAVVHHLGINPSIWGALVRWGDRPKS